MTAKEDVLARLDQAAPSLKVFAVKELWLFGSAAREELQVGSIKTTQRYLNITDEDLRKALTGVWERRRQLLAVEPVSRVG